MTTTIRQLEGYAKQISFGNLLKPKVKFYFTTSRFNSRTIEMQLYYCVKDVVSGRFIRFGSKKESFAKSEDITLYAFAFTVRILLQELVSHEIDEGLLVKGMRIFNPHEDANAVLQTNKKLYNETQYLKSKKFLHHIKALSEQLK